MTRLGMAIVTVWVPLVIAGCSGGGGGLLSLFGNGGGEGGAELLAGAFSDGGSTTSPGESITAGVEPVASLHHPEPASLALFGGGLAGLAMLRRKKARNRTR